MLKMLSLLFVISASISIHADVDSENNPDTLHVAARQGNVAALQELLTTGHKINTIDNNGNTPLHIAAIHGQHAALEFLLEQGANRLSKNSFLDIPLCAAITARVNVHEINDTSTGASRRIIKILLRSQTQEQLKEKDADNRTAFHLAYLFNRRLILPLIAEKIKPSCVLH